MKNGTIFTNVLKIKTTIKRFVNERWGAVITIIVEGYTEGMVEKDGDGMGGLLTAAGTKKSLEQMPAIISRDDNHGRRTQTLQRNTCFSTSKQHLVYHARGSMISTYLPQGVKSLCKFSHFQFMNSILEFTENRS